MSDGRAPSGQALAVPATPLRVGGPSGFDPSRVLVCGGRDFADELHLFRTLDFIHRRRIGCIIHGGARGADTLAGKWAHERGVPCRTFRADWQQYGRAAGAIRNQQMLDEGNPTLVMAFPGGKGTADMVRRARNACVPIQHEVIAGAGPQDIAQTPTPSPDDCGERQ